MESSQFVQGTKDAVRSTDQMAASIGANVKATQSTMSTLGATSRVVANDTAAMTSAFKASADAAHVNTMAMRETLVVARELSRGNFTRLPGSLTLLAQGIGSSGGLAAFASQLGIIKQIKNAELEEEAAAAASAAAGVQGAAEKAAANVAAADTEVALAEAAQRTATTAKEEQAAQARLAIALQAVVEASGEAEIAQNALAEAQARAKLAADAAKAASTTVLGTTGAVLVAVGIAATGAALGFEALKTQVADSGVLRDYADGLGLSSKKMDELKEKTDNFALTFGDVWNGVKKAAEDAFDQSDAWQKFKAGNQSAFKAALDHAVNFASSAYGYVAGSYDTIIQVWHNLPRDLGSAFVSAVNIAITQINNLVQSAVNGLNSVIHAADKIPGVNIGDVSAPKIPLVSGASGPAAPITFSANVEKRRAEAKKKIESGLDTIYGDIIDAAEERIAKDGGTPPKGRHPRERHPGDHGLQEALDKLDAEIKGQMELVDAYEAGDAAVMRATAHQKAEEDAISHKGNVAIFYEKELQLAMAKTAVEGAKRISDLNFEAAAQNKVNKMVEDGIIPASQAKQALQDEMAVRDQKAALENAQQKLADDRHKNDKKAIEEDIKLIQKLKGEIAGLPASQDADAASKATADTLAKIAADNDEIAKMRLQQSMSGHSDMETATAMGQLEANQFQANNPNVDPAVMTQRMQQIVQKAQLGVISPFQQWAKDVPQTAAAISDALQNIAFKGLDDIASSIGDVITGTKSLSQAFSDIAKSIVADLTKMIVKMLLFRALSMIFGGGIPAPNLAAPAEISPDLLNAQPLPSMPGGLALGGPVNAGQTYYVGEQGPEMFVPKQSGTIIPASQLGSRGVNLTIENIDARGATDPGLVRQQVNQGILEAMPLINEASYAYTTRKLSRPAGLGA